jgi:hypothetical protein
MKTLLLFAALAPLAFGQFALARVDGDAERPVGAVLDMGTAYPAETRTVRLRMRNVSLEAVAVSTLGVHGTGFELTAAPKLPIGLPPQEAFELSVTFQAAPTASYSATLETSGLSVLLTAAVTPGVTPSVGPAGLAFGTVEAGTPVTKRVTIANLTDWELPVPPLTVSGEAFTIAHWISGATMLQPRDSIAVELRFAPPGPGNWTGSLAIGERQYPLSGSAVGPPLPRPGLTLDLAEARSGQTGSVSVTFDAASRTAGGGTITLTFEPLVNGATDPAIQFGTIGRSLPFSFAAGDTGLPPVNFQTGTTAGTIAIAVELGGVTERKTVTVPPAPVNLGEVVAIRSAGAIEVRLTGFDNTRTAGAIVYTFYDAVGNALPAISVDNSAEFARYFAESGVGGAFLLRAIFPVSGDASQIVGFAAQMTNSAGTTATGRIGF